MIVRTLKPKRRWFESRLFRVAAIIMVIVLILTTFLMLFSNEVRAVDDYTFDQENVTDGYSTNPTNKNAEDGSYNTLVEEDLYTDTNYSGTTENVVTGTANGGAFPSSLDTDDATRRAYTEANINPGDGTQNLVPTSDVSIGFDATYPTSPTTHFDKLDEGTTNDGDTTYNTAVTAGDRDVFGVGDLSGIVGTPAFDVTIHYWAMRAATGVSSMDVGIRIGTTDYVGLNDVSAGATYAELTYTWTIDPSTSAEWTESGVNAAQIYMQCDDATPDVRVTCCYLAVPVDYTANYVLDVNIVYSSVTSTAQTTSYYVFCQGYRSAAENFGVYAWDYTGLSYTLKTTVQAASDTDYNFALLSTERDGAANEVKLRIVGLTETSDTTQDIVYFDLLKVQRIEQGYGLNVDISSTTVAAYGNITLRIKGYTSAEQFNVNVWNYTSAAYDTGKIAITALSNTWQTTLDLVDASHRSVSTCKIQFTDNTASSADTTRDTLYLDVAWITRYHTDPTITRYGALPWIVGEGQAISFFANYSDYDNEAPTFMYVNIDTSDYALAKNSTDIAYHNGVNYSLAKSDLTAGAHTYYFRAQDANSGVITTSSSTVYVNDTPVLSGDTVLPATGNVGDSFRFEVVFTDADGDLPTYIKARIDSTDYDCLEDDAGDTNTVDGKEYYYNKIMSGGDHTYQFKAKDYYNSEVLSVEKNLHVNNIPALSAYGRAPADPVYVTTELNFTVTFTDADNDLPVSIKWREDGGTTQNVTMTEVTPGDVTTTDGKAYYVLRTLGHGVHNYDFFASDSGSSTSGGSNSVTIVNRDPVISNGPGVSVNEWRNTFWSYDFDGSDADSDTITWGRSGYTWLSIVSGTGVLSGTTPDAMGNYEFTVYANDSYGGQDTYVFTLNVLNRVPVITNGPGVHVDQWRNQAWYYDFDATDADTDSISWVRSGPAWLTIDAVGNLSGTTSDTPGTYTFTIYANDSYGGSDSYAFDMHIENRAPVISNGPGADDDEWRNTAWSYDFDATDADTDTITWGRSGVTWLTIAATGILSGTTTDTPGDYAITVYANDSYGGQDTYLFTLHILNRAPTITNGPGVNVDEWRNTFWSYDFNFADADGDTMTWERSGAAWLTIVGGSGVLSGTTTDTPGDYPFTVYANDSYGGSANYPFTMHILNRVPVITSAGNTTQELGTYMAYLVTATDADTDGLTCELSTNASWLSISGFWVNGTAAGIGWYACTIWVNDSYGGSDSDYWEVTVWSAANQPPSYTSSPIDSAGHPVNYYYDCNASDPEADPLTFDISSTHPNLVIDPATGEVSGYIATAGTWWVNISVTDSEFIVWQNYTLTTTNTVPSFTSVPIESVPHPVDYYFDSNATDADGDTLTYGLAGNCTPMLSIDPVTGEVSGYISLPGWWYVQISVTDSYSTVWQNFTLTATNTAPTFTSTPTESWEHGTLYTYDANAVDLNGDSYTFDLEGNCTTFLSIIPGTGVITGTVPTVGWWYVNVSVSDAWSTTWQSYVLTGLNTAPTFTSSGITEWQNGTLYYYDANGNDINSDTLAWAIEGNGTSFLSIDPLTGEVGGMLPSMGWWYVNISLSDSWSTVWQNYTLYALNTAPVITTIPGTTGEPGTEYSYDANATDLNGDTIVWDATEKPIWLVVDPVTGECTGIPVIDGSYDVELRAFDGLAYDWQNWTIVVTTFVPPEPEVPSEDEPDYAAPYQARFTYWIKGLTVVVDDASIGDIQRWQWSFGDGFGSQGTYISHEYDKAGTYTITLTIIGPDGQRTSTQVTITVQDDDSWYIDRTEVGWAIVTPMGSLNFSAILLLALGAGMLILSVIGPKHRIIKSKLFKGIAIGLMVLGVLFYAY